ncbi:MULTISPECIES: hypothetical protein [unclassified Acidovorax]|uniref:hypothetical protein n=1 Tax=unclassified Acidovorax TaxID=2684926 RepID=UPI0028834BA9|nr:MULTISPECIES: hypothetical protein [unclassified Acidovorax]
MIVFTLHRRCIPPVSFIASGKPGQPVEPDVPGVPPEPADTPPYLHGFGKLQR